MGCHHFKFGNSTGIITLANGYKYQGFYFEWHSYLGPTKMNKNGEMSKRAGREFYKMIDRWIKLSDKEKEKTRIYG